MSLTRLKVATVERVGFNECVCVVLQVIYLQKAELNRETVYAMHPSSVNGVEDMSTLAELHEAAIMHNLFLRYQRDSIYVSHHHRLSVRAHLPCAHHGGPGSCGSVAMFRGVCFVISAKWNVQDSLDEISKYNKSLNHQKHQLESSVHFLLYQESAT